MLAEAKIITCIATTMPEKSREFYQDLLGLALIADEPGTLVFDANGTMLRITQVPGFAPALFTVLGWEVANIEADVDQLASRGIKMQKFEGIAQDERGVATFPDGTKLAWWRDPDGNLLSLTQFQD